MVFSCAKLRIGGRTLADRAPTFIIEEAGMNHDGKTAQGARKLYFHASRQILPCKRLGLR
jgi:sialic acid synthase SpsE